MRIKTLALLLTLMLAGISTGIKAESLTPDIIFPKPGSECILSGMSDNGKWAVYGSSVIDITTNPFVFKEIGGSVRDISDDGKTAVGSNGGGPAVWKEGIGWKRLPLPAGTSGGSASKLTPDGRYAVGTVGLGIVNSSDGCLWDLETLSIIEMPDRPLEDRAFHTNDPNPLQNQYDAISGDGRYVLGTLAYSYVGYQMSYVYDRETCLTRYIGYEKQPDGTYTPTDPMIHYTECEGMSSDGHYVTGPVYILKGEEYIAAYRYDVWNDTLEYFDEGMQADSWAFSVSDEGLVFLRKTAHSPYSEGYVCYNGFFYSFRDILTIGYGIDLADYNIDNTGVPVRCSADGRCLIFINSPTSSYFVRFKEDLKDVCERLELLKTWTASPRSGSVMSRISSLSVDFSYPIEANPEDYTKVELLDGEGNVLSHPVTGGGLAVAGNSLKISFRPQKLEVGEEYTVRIPAGICHVSGLPSKTNSEILLRYTGRNDGPVKITGIAPREGTGLASLDLQENPVLLTFDAALKLNTSAAETAKLYIDEATDPVAVLYAGLYDENVLALFPANKVNLYAGSTYTLKVPEGIVTDLSGFGPSEAFEISYEGIFRPVLGDEKYLFRSSCDNWDNFLFFEGDHGIPEAEYALMGFTADNTPWWVVMDNATSTDMAFASHSCYTDGRQADDWVVTRQIMIPDETVCLKFDGQSYRKAKQDILTIYAYPYEGVMNSLSASDVDKIRENGDIIFEERLLPGDTEDGIDGEWTHYVVPLEKYAGKNLYIAFVNRNRNQSMVMIDNVEVSRKVDAFITLTNAGNVVSQSEIYIKGLLNVENQLEVYSTVSLILEDSEGNEVSTVRESGLSLEAGDSFAFAFPDPLPLMEGEENGFTIRFELDDKSDSYSSVVRNLTFKPEKRVVLEEFTGRDCQFCPQGHAMIERLSETFGSSFIPVGLYCYNGTDPKGMSVMDYWTYLGMTAAPSARINRRETTMAMTYYSPDGRYVYSASEIPGGGENLWYDEVVAELAEPAFLDISVESLSSAAGRMECRAHIKSAIRLANQNLRLFGVLMENGIDDYQSNGMYETEDPLLGKWGKGGSLGSNIVYSTFDHVAKGTWGLSYNGTGNLLPSDIEADASYSIDMTMDIPRNVDKIENCEFIAMIIDGNTGRILNAASTSSPSGITVPATELEGDLSITVRDGAIVINSSSEATVSVFTLSGLLLTSASGDGSFTLPYYAPGTPVIIHAATQSETLTRKIILP